MPVTLTAPKSGEKIEVLSAQEVIFEVKTRTSLVGFGEGYLKKMTDSGRFPAPIIEISKRRGYEVGTVEKWIAERQSQDRISVIDDTAARMKHLKGKDLDRALADLKQKIQAEQ